MKDLQEELRKKVVTTFDVSKPYIELSDAIDISSSILACKEKSASETNISHKPISINKTLMLKYFFSRKILLLSLMVLIAMNVDTIAFMFGYEFNWIEKIRTLFKIIFVIPIAIATSQTINHVFKELEYETEEGVPSPKTVIYYITQSWLLYILLSTGLTIYSFNLESIGIESLADFVATFNTITSLLAISQFIMWRWFRLYYNFIFSTIDDVNDSSGTFTEISPIHKTYISIIIILGLLWISKDIFISFLSR